MAWVFVGLGNPGEEYEETRHNTGRMALAYYAKRSGAPQWKEDSKSHALTTGAHVGRHMCALVLPNTFMNKSGAVAAKFVKSVKAAERLVVLHDDLDLPLGSIKLSFNRGSGGHKGIESIAKALKTKKFVRIRVGVSPSTPSGKVKKPTGEKEVVDFILARFKSAEIETLKKVFRTTADAIETIVTDGLPSAMNSFN